MVITFLLLHSYNDILSKKHHSDITISTWGFSCLATSQCNNNIIFSPGLVFTAQCSVRFHSSSHTVLSALSVSQEHSELKWGLNVWAFVLVLQPFSTGQISSCYKESCVTSGFVQGRRGGSCFILRGLFSVSKTNLSKETISEEWASKTGNCSEQLLPCKHSPKLILHWQVHLAHRVLRVLCTFS